MAEFQTALPPDNIFLLDKDKPFADTSIETWATIISMFGDLHEENYRWEDSCYTPDQTVADELYRKNPFLKFTKGKPRPGNPYWEFRARVYVWSAAFDALGYGQFKQDHDYNPWSDRRRRRSFPKNTNKLSQADYEWLWNPAWLVECDRDLIDFEDILCDWDRPSVSNRKDLILRRYAYGELWDFTQRLKLQDLTSAQEQDRQKLELWTISRIKEALIAYELEPACPGRMAESDFESDEIYDKYKENPIAMEFFYKAKAVATRIVERRIAKGNWQVRGSKYTFKFNGIETNTSCCEQERA